MNEDGNYASLPAELSSFTSSTFEPRQERMPDTPKKMSSMEQQQQQHQQQYQQQQHIRRPRPNENLHEFVGNRRKIGSIDVFGQNMENLVQLEDPMSNRKLQAKSLDEIREEPSRRHARSVLGLEKLMVGLENNLQEQHYARNALRRNQSFDHARYSSPYFYSSTLEPISCTPCIPFSVCTRSLFTVALSSPSRRADGVHEWKVRRQVF